MDTVTSYGAAGGSSSSSSGAGRVVLNQVLRTYNAFGQLTAEYQEHDGEVDTQTTPVVQYAYADGSAGHVRPKKITYPNGRVLRYEYNSGTDDALGRISFLADDDSGAVGTHLAEYTRLGLGAIVQVDYPEPQLRYDLAHGAGDDPYGGLDRFGRVKDLLWRDYGASTDAVRIKHGYDRAGNRLWREDPVAASYGKDFDELYSYDGMYQLKSLQRGDLSANHDAIVQGTKVFGEDWSLDMTGNWSQYRKDDDGDGTWDLDQSRTHDPANEITAIAGSSAQVAHDRAGNMTRIPKPEGWGAGFELVFDAWNRLVKVLDAGQESNSSSSSSSGSEPSVVAEYDYDGLMRRIVKTVQQRASDSSSSSSSSRAAESEIRHFFYTASWQCLEERVDTATAADRQFVWGLRYIDDLVLRDRDVETGGDLGKPTSGLDERLYALQDPNWNVVAIADATGAIAERYSYAAYGRPTFLTPTFGTRASSSFAWDTLYAGCHSELALGLGTLRTRDLIVALGRFTARDKSGSRGYDLDMYRYVLNSPLRYADPLGTDPLDLSDLPRAIPPSIPSPPRHRAPPEFPSSGDTIRNYRFDAFFGPGFCRRNKRPSFFSNRIAGLRIDTGLKVAGQATSSASR